MKHNPLTKADRMLIDVALCYLFNNAKQEDLIINYDGILRLAEIRTDWASEDLLKGLSKQSLKSISKEMANRFINK